MLLILIPTGWLAIVAFFVILCQAAARGDEDMQASAGLAHPAGLAPRRGVRLWEESDIRLRPSSAIPLATRARARTAGTVVRRRRPGCIAGS
ncbi:MAG TPA: hypothetical protein VGO14_09465 [Solirubrobacteraceae bacterium]|jgi:hypothetical protein|nr:hypothetical protein [Solirubrobacteraceae bacterium]